MSKRATIRDIALMAQTSVATVSWVLNGNSRKYVSDELRDRVIEAAHLLNYQPNLLAQRLKGKSRKLLAVVVPQFENIFFNHIVIGAEKYANNLGYRLLICSTDDNHRKEVDLVNQLIANWVDGFLIAPTPEGADAVENICRSGIPLVIVDRKIDKVGADIDYVGTDNLTAAYLGVRYLLDKGHRRIAYIGWDTCLQTLLDRNIGFFKAAGEFDIAPEDVVMRKCARDPEAGFRVADQILKEFQPTAIFVDQNNIADGVVKAIRSFNLRIPEDLSVLIYGEPTWAVLNVPEFTCIALPDFEIGAYGARILIEKLEGRSYQPRTIYLPGRLAERASVRMLPQGGGIV